MPATLTKLSPCKVNLLLNILGKRADGFHELETVIHPVAFHDELSFSKGGDGVQLTCSDTTLPTDSRNLVHRAATSFLKAAGSNDGLRIHLEKKIPQAAGLGGGSGNAATTLLGLNELFGNVLPPTKLHELAAALGSDIPFFLQSKPALATGRGEKIRSLGALTAMRGTCFLLIHPGFGISTAWSYQNLARFPKALNGEPGRAEHLVRSLDTGSLKIASGEFYNSLEAPALEKYPVLAQYQEFLRVNGAAATLMSGSGSTTFAIMPNQGLAETALEKFKERFGATCWTAIVPVD